MLEFPIGNQSVQTLNPQVVNSQSQLRIMPQYSQPQYSQPVVQNISSLFPMSIQTISSHPRPIIQTSQQPQFIQVQQQISPQYSQPIMTTTHTTFPYQSPLHSQQTIERNSPENIISVTNKIHQISPTHTYIQQEIVKEEEPIERVFMNVSNPHLVDEDHIEYDVTLISNLPEHGFLGHSLTVQKRYNDFYDLHLQISEILGDDAKLLPEFPSIIWYNFGIFGYNLEEEVFRDRLEKFNYLMKFIAKDKYIRVSRIVDDFFGISILRSRNY